MNDLAYEPQTLPGCTTLPPIDRKSAKRQTGTPKKTRHTSNRFAVLNGFIDFTMRDLRRGDIAVWLILYRDTKNGIAATAQTDMAKRAGVSVRTVRNAIKRLESLGLLKVVFRGGTNRGVSKYRVYPFDDETRGKPVAG